MSEKRKSLLFALMFAVFGVTAFVYCFGDATLVLFGTIQLRGFFLDAYLFLFGGISLFISFTFLKSMFKKDGDQP